MLPEDVYKVKEYITLESGIDVHGRLLILQLFSSLPGLIPDYPFINLNLYFRPARLFHPTLLFKSSF